MNAATEQVMREADGKRSYAPMALAPLPDAPPARDVAPGEANASGEGGEHG